MRSVHLAVGLVVIGAFGLLWIWGLGAWLLKRTPGRAFWWLVATVQVAVLAQLLAGIVLLVLGGSVGWLHLVYGAGVPVLVLVAAHVIAREERFEDRPWAPFALAGFFAFFSTIRALQTGLGIG